MITAIMMGIIALITSGLLQSIIYAVIHQCLVSVQFSEQSTHMIMIQDYCLLLSSQHQVGGYPPSSVPIRLQGCTFVCSTYLGLRKCPAACFLPHLLPPPSTCSLSAASDSLWGEHFSEGDQESLCQVRNSDSFFTTIVALMLPSPLLLAV